MAMKCLVLLLGTSSHHGENSDRRSRLVAIEDSSKSRLIVLGLYGLIAAKTYLQVTGAYDHNHEETGVVNDQAEIPACFVHKTNSITQDTAHNGLLVIDSASDIGGTWAEERLYPNLLSQNSYGLYEFSDLSLSDVVPEDEGDDTRNQFIAGWKISQYLRAWAVKWKLKKHIRLNWTVRP
jgi:hypothetical protein